MKATAETITDEQRHNGLARFAVASIIRGDMAGAVTDKLSLLAYGTKAVPPGVVRDLLTRGWLVSAGPGRGYTLTATGKLRLAEILNARAEVK